MLQSAVSMFSFVTIQNPKCVFFDCFDYTRKAKSWLRAKLWADSPFGMLDKVFAPFWSAQNYINWWMYSVQNAEHFVIVLRGENRSNWIVEGFQIGMLGVSIKELLLIFLHFWECLNRTFSFHSTWLNWDLLHLGSSAADAQTLSARLVEKLKMQN